MENVEATGVGFMRDKPAFTFRVTLRDGRDFDGKFKIAFAAIEAQNERRLAITEGTQQNLLASLNKDNSLRVINAMLDANEYVVCINYDNAVYEIPPNTVAIPILGRVAGDEFDWVEETPLPDDHVDALHEIRSVIKAQ